MKRKTMFLAAVAFSVFTGAATAAVIGVDLGTVAPSSSLGPFTLIPYATAPQAAIADFTIVTTIPGGPTLTVSPGADKRTVPASWTTWSHAYVGPVFFNGGGTTATLTLPPSTHAFQLYVEPNTFGAFNVTVFPGFGAPVTVSVNGSGGANGFGFYATAGETLKTLVITADPGAGGFAMAEFASAQADLSVPALEPGMLAALAVLLLGAGIWMQRRRRA